MTPLPSLELALARLQGHAQALANHDYEEAERLSNAGAYYERMATAGHEETRGTWRPVALRED